MVFVEINSEEMDINKWLAISHIAGGLNIPNETAKTTIQTQLINL